MFFKTISPILSFMLISASAQAMSLEESDNKSATRSPAVAPCSEKKAEDIAEKPPTKEDMQYVADLWRKKTGKPTVIDAQNYLNMAAWVAEDGHF